MNTEIEIPKWGWYRENKPYYEIEYTYMDGKTVKIVTPDRNCDIHEQMYWILSNKNIKSIRLVSEPIGCTETELISEANGSITHNSWSNCD